MVKKFALSALCAGFMGFAHAEVQTFSAPFTGQAPDQISLIAVVDAGTGSYCGMREAPHLIEHLLLTGTSLGVRPPDAIAALRDKGITLSAITHPDMTEYTLTGPVSAAGDMESALLSFLGRSSVPKIAFEDEKQVILRELNQTEDYISNRTVYEVMVAAIAGQDYCAADAIKFVDYTYDDVNNVYQALYQDRAIKVIADAPEGTFDLEALADVLNDRFITTEPKAQSGISHPAEMPELRPMGSATEIVFPIAGRKVLGQDLAQNMADEAKIAVQRYVRSKHNLYTVRTYAAQGLNGGWIRIEVPYLPDGENDAIAEIVKTSFAKVLAVAKTSDPLTISYADFCYDDCTMPPLVVLPKPNAAEQESFLLRILHTLLGFLKSAYELISF